MTDPPAPVAIVPIDDELRRGLRASRWRIEYTNDDGMSWSMPLVGWGLTADNRIVPITAYSVGKVYDPAVMGGKYRIYHLGS